MAKLLLEACGVPKREGARFVGSGIWSLPFEQPGDYYGRHCSTVFFRLPNRWILVEMGPRTVGYVDANSRLYSVISYKILYTLPETDSSALANRPSQKETSVFQPSIFRCDILVSGTGVICKGFQPLTWRIIPVSKWLITMVSKSFE